MCQIIQSPTPSLGTLLEQLLTSDPGSMTDMLEGKRVPAPVGSAITNHSTPDLHIRCYHKDGRTDEYHVGPGERLVISEEAELELLNPEECDPRIPESETRAPAGDFHKNRSTGQWN